MTSSLMRLTVAAVLAFLSGTTLATAQTRRTPVRDAAARVSFAQPASRPPADSAANGAAIGALIGGGGMAAMLAILSSRCGAGCENDLEPWAPYAAVGVGAAGGAAVGYLIDKLHRGSPRKVAVTPAVSRRERGVRVAVRF